MQNTNESTWFYSFLKYPVPSQPEQFSGEAVSAFQIQLSWIMRDTDTLIERYELYYNVSAPDQGGPMHKTISPATSYALDDLRPNTLYHIRLAARSETGEGASSPVIGIKTLESGEIYFECEL